MRIKLESKGQIDLTIKALEGKFDGLHIATVEGIAISNAFFCGSEITGHTHAVWGAVLNDDICSDAPTLFGLGINQPFPVFKGRQAVFDGERHVDNVNGMDVVFADHVIIVRGVIHYA